MTTRAEIIATDAEMAVIVEARTWIGTPWVHQGRLKGVGVDCAGLTGKVGETKGYVSSEDANFTGYGREPDPIKMKAALDRVFIRIVKESARPASIIWLKAGGDRAQHLGILTERNTLIHAINFKRVEELPIEAGERNRVVACYRYRGIDD